MKMHEIMFKLNMWNLMHNLFGPEFAKYGKDYLWNFSKEEREAFIDLSKSYGWSFASGWPFGLRYRCTLVRGPND